MIRFGSGAWLTLCVTQLDSNPKEGQLEITGTKTTYIMDQRRWKVITPGPNASRKIEDGMNPKSEGWRFYQNIAEHLTGKADLVITSEWARRPIHILDLANQSAIKKKGLEARYK